MKDFVVLKLEVEQMRHAMVAAIAQKHSDIEYYINKACDDFIASGRMEKEISDQMQRVFAEEIKNYFSYGEGNLAITEAIKAGFKKHPKGKPK